MTRNHKTITIASGLIGLLMANSALAQNLIQNPGFSTGDLTGWTPINAGPGASISVLPTGGDPGDYAWLNNSTEAYNLALSQVTPNGSAVGAGITVSYSFDLLGGSQAAGGVDFIHIFDENATGGVISQGPGLLGPYFPSASGWTAYSGSFTTVAGSDHLYIEFDATTGANAGAMDQMGVDNVVLSVPASVPEPTTLSLAVMGIVGALKFRRSRHA
jgi:hypothetical protein